jgi:S-(hydroxymethyl)glutathione dehydrogenase / alcohol dehydrogenase
MSELKAAVLQKLDGKLNILSNIKSSTLKDYQLLVKIFYSGVCRSQLMEVDGCRGHDDWLPHMLGHEASGQVIELGPKVSKFSKNDLVVATWIKSQGGESKSSTYEADDKIINAGSVTTFSNYAIISENKLVKLDQRVPLHLAVTLGCAVPTGAGMVFNQIKNPDNKSLAIFGLGGIGLSSLLAAKNLNFSKIIVVDIDEKKLNLAKQIGVDLTINSKTHDPIDQIMTHTLGGANFCVDASGISKVIEQAFLSSNSNEGVTIFASHPPEGEKLTISPHDLIKGRRLLGSWGGGAQPDKDIPKYTSLYLEGKFDLELLVDKIYQLDQINIALEDLRSGNCSRPVIKMSHN